MVKVFLVSPNERGYNLSAGDRMPIGILYLSTALNSRGVETKIFDLNHSKRDELLTHVAKEKPDFVGLSIISSPSFKQMRALAEELRPYTKLIAGGFHVSAQPNDLEGVVDTIVIGDGERAILRAINGEKGIIEEKIDVNEFPIPDRAKVDARRYNLTTAGLRTAPIVLARGCPYSCIFCGNMHKNVKFRDLGNIEDEIGLLKETGYEAVYLYKESGTLNGRHSRSVGQLLKRYGLKYRLETRADLIDEETAEMLSETGCILVALGIESGDNNVLDKIGKRLSVEENERAVELLSRHKIDTKGYFIFGLPYQDYDSGLKTIEFAKRLKRKGMSQADFYVLTPFPGSPIARNPEKYGIKILSKDYDQYLQVRGNTVEPVIETEWLGREEIKSLADRARAEWNSS